MTQHHFAGDFHGADGAADLPEPTRMRVVLTTGDTVAEEEAAETERIVQFRERKDNYEHVTVRNSMAVCARAGVNTLFRQNSARSLMTCFSYMCCLAGVAVNPKFVSPSQLTDAEATELSSKDGFRIHLISFGHDDKRNHIELVHCSSQIYRSNIVPIAEGIQNQYIVSVTSMQHFFQKNSEWYLYCFYADDGASAADDTSTVTQGTFGDAFHSTVQEQPPTAGFASASRLADTGSGVQQPYAAPGLTYSSQARPPPPESIADDSFNSGAANVTGGVTRNRRRRIKAVINGPRTDVQRGYGVSGAIMFNNLDEMYQDCISRDYAQEIIEALFKRWSLPTEQPDTMKYAEDLLWAFMIATTASNKANYNREFPIPVRPTATNAESELLVNFEELSRLLAYTFDVTRRQFARGIADDQRRYLTRDENVHLKPALATRIGCEPGMAHLGFDGSTHCSDLTTREQTFTRTLESRNLFERDDVVAQGATDRLMQGFSGGSRSVAPR